MIETINITVDSKDLEEFKETTGMTVGDCIKLLMDNVKYGGHLGFDPFWSEENQKHLQKSIREMEEGKVVKFTSEEWEKFVNEQDI